MSVAKAPPCFTVTIHGETPPKWRPDQWHSVSYLLERLLRGQEIALEEFQHYGLQVAVAEDCDQGDDKPAVPLRGDLDGRLVPVRTQE